MDALHKEKNIEEHDSWGGDHKMIFPQHMLTHILRSIDDVELFVR